MIDAQSFDPKDTVPVTTVSYSNSFDVILCFFYHFNLESISLTCQKKQKLIFYDKYQVTVQVSWAYAPPKFVRVQSEVVHVVWLGRSHIMR